MIDVEVGGRRPLVLMAVQAMHGALVGVINEHYHRVHGRRYVSIDVEFGVMAGAAAIDPDGMLSQDLGKGANDVAICTGFAIDLTEVGLQVELNGVIEGATSQAMVMTIKIGAMTTTAVPAGGGRREDQGSIGDHVMTGRATFGGVNLTGSGEGRGGGNMATGAVGCDEFSIWINNHVLSDLGTVVVAMSIKVIRMAVSTGAALTAVDGGITMAPDPVDPRTVNA